VFEKTLKLYCQLVVLEGKSRENRKDSPIADLVSEQSFTTAVGTLITKYLLPQSCTDLSTTEQLAIQQVILDNLVPITDHYWQCLSTIFLDSYKEFS